jgi:hypothetical protein
MMRDDLSARNRSAGWLSRFRPESGAVSFALSVVISLLSLPTPAAFAWGLTGHEIVTREAVRRLPPALAPFYGSAADLLVEKSYEPDTVLKDRDPREPRRHYINLDELEEPPFDDLPPTHEEAEERYGEERLSGAGTLPYRVKKMMAELTQAMRSGEREAIVRSSGYLSHYVADAHQPLHLTSNFDGQKTCNAGIHDAFESGMIERFASKYGTSIRQRNANVTVVRDPFRRLLRHMQRAYLLVQEILDADTAALEALKTQGEDYFENLDRQAGSIAEQELSSAANLVASLWQTAWVRAGKPELLEP